MGAGFWSLPAALAASRETASGKGLSSAVFLGVPAPGAADWLRHGRQLPGRGYRLRWRVWCSPQHRKPPWLRRGRRLRGRHCRLSPAAWTETKSQWNQQGAAALGPAFFAAGAPARREPAARCRQVRGPGLALRRGCKCQQSGDGGDDQCGFTIGVNRSRKRLRGFLPRKTTPCGLFEAKVIVKARQGRVTHRCYFKSRPSASRFPAGASHDRGLRLCSMLKNNYLWA